MFCLTGSNRTRFATGQPLRGTQGSPRAPRLMYTFNGCRPARDAPALAPPPPRPGRSPAQSRLISRRPRDTALRLSRSSRPRKGHTVLNECSLAFAHRHSLPLHFEVFRRCAPHMPHEGNVEGWFSTTKGLAQPSSHPDWTATLAHVSINNRVHRPPRQLLWRMYVEQYRSHRAPKEDEQHGK